MVREFLGLMMRRPSDLHRWLDFVNNEIHNNRIDSARMALNLMLELPLNPALNARRQKAKDTLDAEGTLRQ